MSRVRFIDHSPGWFGSGAPAGRYILATDLLGAVDDVKEMIKKAKPAPTTGEAVNQLYEDFIKKVLAI